VYIHIRSVVCRSLLAQQTSLRATGLTILSVYMFYMYLASLPELSGWAACSRCAQVQARLYNAGMELAEFIGQSPCIKVSASVRLRQPTDNCIKAVHQGGWKLW